MYIYPGLRVLVGNEQYPIAAAAGHDGEIDIYILRAGQLVRARGLVGYQGIIHAPEDIGTPHYRKNLKELSERLDREEKENA